MKPNIHPKYQKTIIKCACGATYEVGSTKENIHVELCSACHPFFTGKQKIVDTAGRVERFQKRYKKKAVSASEPSAESSESNEKSEQKS